MTMEKMSNLRSDLYIRFPDIDWIESDLLTAEMLIDLGRPARYGFSGTLGELVIHVDLHVSPEGFQFTVVVPEDHNRDDLMMYDGHLFILGKIEMTIYRTMAKARLLCRLLYRHMLKAWSVDRAFPTLQNDWLVSFICFPVELIIRSIRR